MALSVSSPLSTIAGTHGLNLPDGTTAACLTGQTTNGIDFMGCDSVRLVK
jgi:hypothetical protein